MHLVYLFRIRHVEFGRGELIVRVEAQAPPTPSRKPLEWDAQRNGRIKNSSAVGASNSIREWHKQTQDGIL